MRKTKMVLIGTILLLGNLSVALQAKPLGLFSESGITQPDYSADESITALLHQQGLDKEVAQERARDVFGVNELQATIGMHNLYTHVESVSAEVLHRLVAKRALFGKQVDLASYDALVSLVHEIKGAKVDMEELRTLGKVAEMNRFFSGGLKVEWKVVA